MSEVLEQAAEVSVAEETAAEQHAAEQHAVEQSAAEEAKGGEEMPREERAKQAARRRAAEQRAEALKNSSREQRLREQVLQHPLVQEAMGLLEATRFRQDLDRVRAEYPDLTAESPDQVGEIYCRLMASGTVDPVVAYEAQLAADRRREPALGDMVSVGAAGGAALYYSSRELDRLSQKDLEDPNVFRKALSSLAKLR